MTTRVHVNLDNRTFIVKFGDDGGVRQIAERKEKTPPMGGYYLTLVWYHTRSLGVGDTLPKRILAAARAKLGEE